jgi:hypothetical protein
VASAAPAPSRPGQLARRLSALGLAFVLAACGNPAADSAAPGTPTSSPSVEAPEVWPTEVEPSETEPTRIEPTKPLGTPIPKPKPADVAAAKKLVVTGKDVGDGWETSDDYDVDEIDVHGDGISIDYLGDTQRYCNNPLPADRELLFTAASEATERTDAEREARVRHEVALYRPGGAARAVAELDQMFADCQEQRDIFFDGPEEIVVSAKGSGPRRADITVQIGSVVAERGALAYVVRGDFVSTVLAFAPTTAAARALVDKVAALAAAKFAAKVNR